METTESTQAGTIPREVQELLEALPSDPMDLLSPDERRQLNADLANIAKTRRRAEAESAFIVMH